MEGTNSLIDLSSYPDELRKHIEKDIQKYGEHQVLWVLQTANVAKMIKVESEKEKSNPRVWFQMLVHLLDRIATTDPFPNHYASAREIIAISEGGTPEDQDAEAVNLLALELVQNCQKIKILILDKTTNRNITEEILIDISTGEDKMHSTRSENEMLWADSKLLKFISLLGLKGKDLSETLKESYQSRYKTFCEEGCKNMPELWKIWITDKETFTPPFLKTLCIVLWKDVVKPKWEKKKRLKIPAVPLTLWVSPVQQMLVKGNKTTETEGTIELLTENDKILAKVNVASVDKSMIEMICKGFKDLTALTGHKTYRWLVHTGFDNVVYGCENSDHRLIKTEGGYSGISDLIGCKAKDDPQRVKRILNAFAHGHLALPNGTSGNLIALEVMKKHRNGHPSSINIVLGTMLLPHGVFELPRGNRLLVPVPNLPEFIGDTSSHASQSMFQLLMFEEFTNRSRELANKGYIHLPEERWKEIGEKAHLAKSVLHKVKHAWTQEDGMLEQDGEFFTLNKKKHQAELDFLIEQGKIREVGSTRSKKGKQQRMKQIKKRKKV